MYHAKGQYSLYYLENLDKDQWLNLKSTARSDIRLALSESIVFAKGEEKNRLMEIRSKLIRFSMERK